MLLRILTLAMALLAPALVDSASAAPLSADQIITKAYNVDGGRDGISRLTFTFRKPSVPDKKLVYTMVWKLYGGEGGVESKLLFFSEFPPDDLGKAFMGYLYTDKRLADYWMYLPELRMVRKMGHEHRHDDDDFAHSDLTHTDLVPRKPDADTHRLVKEESNDGHDYYVVESIPKPLNQASYPYARTLKWISKDHFLTEKINYYRGDKVEKTARFQWKKIDTHWVWEQVTAEDLKDGGSTTLSISDIRVNLGLKDQVFSARSLSNGLDSVPH